MALNISKKATPFIESLSTKERQYLNELGQRIKGSRNDINIDEFGKVKLTYRPKASEIRLVNDSNREAINAEKKFKNKNVFRQIKIHERFTNK